MTRLSRLSVALLLSMPLVARADEGMWMPQQIPDLAARLQALGFQGDPKAFADLTGYPMGAVVSLGGCTASFVSPDGLMVTNHHCATRALQYNSKPGANLLRDGFLALTREEEVSTGPGARLWVTTSVREVTASILGRMDASLGDRQRYDLVERRVKEQTALCEKSARRCRVASFFRGMRYFEIAELEIQDLRLVYAPAEGVGNFGGETDNWRWPRHTGDYTFLRAYVGKDGKPAPFDERNVAFRPKHFLRVSKRGVGPGDLVFVAGYPARTQRHQTYAQVRETTEWSFPRVIRSSTEQIASLEALARESPELEIKVADRLRALKNGLTNRQGMLEGLLRGGILEKKERMERELQAWIVADPIREAEYGDVLEALAALLAETEKTRERDAVLANLLKSSSLLQAASTIHRLSLERPKRDVDRELGFQARDFARIREAQDRLQRTLDPRVDRVLLRHALGLAAQLPAPQRIVPLDERVGMQAGMAQDAAFQAIDAYLEKLLAGTRLLDRDHRISLLLSKTAELLASRDPMIELAAALETLERENRNQAKRRAGRESILGPRLMKALLEKGGGLVAPDANATLRVTFGEVKGVDNRDGIFWKPQTSLRGIEEKHTGEGEFDAPKATLRAIEQLRAGKPSRYLDGSLGDIPVNFLSTVDTTGGNSGSPTLDASGELVGLLFDGTYDTIASDFLYDSRRTRSIHVDIRYVLFTMLEADGASHLVREMGIE